MSRLGRMSIEIPAGVTVTISNSDINVKGPKGTLDYKMRPEVEAKIEGNELKVSPKFDAARVNQYWGLTRSLIASMVEGVSKGFEKKLELVGVGYRAKQNGKNISLTLGFSHPVEITAPEGIQLEAVDNTNIFIRGYDKRLVGQVAATIRKLRKPEPYKGKGIKYSDEIIRRKAGKAAKAGAK